MAAAWNGVESGYDTADTGAGRALPAATEPATTGKDSLYVSFSTLGLGHLSTAHGLLMTYP